MDSTFVGTSFVGIVGVDAHIDPCRTPHHLRADVGIRPYMFKQAIFHLYAKISPLREEWGF